MKPYLMIVDHSNQWLWGWDRLSIQCPLNNGAVKLLVKSSWRKYIRRHERKSNNMEGL